MAFKLGWFAILGARDLDIARVMTAAARHAPVDARPHDGFQIGRQGAVCSVVLGSAYGHTDQWAQAVSLVARCTTIGFFLLEGQWGYVVCHAGAVIGGMEGYPLAKPQLYGNLERAARLLGTKRDLLERYCRGAGDQSVRAFAGDEHAPSDELAHCDLARRLGISDPLADETFAVLAAPPVSKRQTWRALAKGPERPSERRAALEPKERITPGWHNRNRFEIVVRIGDAKTSLEIDGDPMLAETDLDDEIALGRIEAAALRQVAGQVDRGRYPFERVTFGFGRRRDAATRDRLLFGRAIDWRREPTGRVEFSGLDAPTLARLIRDGFCDPDPDLHGIDGVVRPCDWLDVLWRYPEVRARGAAISPLRPDHRFDIDGVDGKRAATATREARALTKAAARAPSVEIGFDLLIQAPPHTPASVVNRTKASVLRELADALEAGHVGPVDYVQFRHRLDG